MKTKFDLYREGPLPNNNQNQLWPLYGAGLKNMGENGLPITDPLPKYGPDELLVRHDACSLCFSDIKVIRLGEDHPRIYRNMKENPVVLGHEVAITVVGVGENLQDQYIPGDRFILQADIFVDGVGYAYGYEIQGGLSQYNVIDQRILSGDHGNYLIPIKADTGYAEAALIEPWACVITAYNLTYRTGLKNYGTAWFIGPDEGVFSISEGFNHTAHPSRIKMTDMAGAFSDWIRQQAKALQIPVEDVPNIETIQGEDDADFEADDIILLSPTTDLIEKISPRLADHGILAFFAEGHFPRKANLDIGRVHYNRWLFIGGNDRDIASIYNQNPVRSQLLSGGRALFLGAGGPMGRMHVQHAVEKRDHPALIVCTDVSNERLKDLQDTFAAEAKERGIEWLCLNPMDKIRYQGLMNRFQAHGFDDIIILVPKPEVILEALKYLREDGVINVFAGVARGTTSQIDLNNIAFHNVRVIGHSASLIEDMLTMRHKVENGELSTNRSVAAIGSLSAAKDGMQALINATYPGKVVIYPNIQDLPLTRLTELQQVLPAVAEKLLDNHIWTKEAERTLLERMAKD